MNEVEKATDDNYKKLVAIAVMVIENLDNTTLTAFNIGIQTSGKIEKYNRSYQDALDLRLINENGYPYDLDIIRDASAFEVNRRVRENRFN